MKDKFDIDLRTWARMGEKAKTKYFEENDFKYPYDFYHRIYQHIRSNLAYHERWKEHPIEGKKIEGNALMIAKVAERDNYKCHYCGISNEKSIDLTGKRLTIDRKDPNKGYTEENCALACHKCNQLKGNILNEEEALIVAPIFWKAVARYMTQSKKLGKVRANFVIKIV